MTLLLVLVMSSLGSIGSTAGAGLLLALGAWVSRAVPYLVSFATGTLLAGAFLGLLPEALEVAPTFTVMTALIVGLLGFFILERLVIWRHCHHEDCDVHGASGYLILVGDAFHNFMDGVAIGAAFAASPPLGISTALAVVAHEVPQEVGDFGILLNSGFSKGRAFALNLGSAATTIPGAVVAFFAFSAVEQVLGIVLALAASSFLYIALADLIPGLHREWSLSALPVQVGLIVLGVVVIMTTHVMAH
jgi:zinc and cadmium transporter